MGRMIESGKHEKSLFKIRHPDSGRSIGQDQFMNQEWYSTTKGIAQIMIVFIAASMYDELKTQIWYFINVAVARLFCAATCQQAHWTRWSLLQEPNFNQAGGDCWRQN